MMAVLMLGFWCSSAFASDIGLRVRDDPALNHDSFVSVMVAYLYERITATTAATRINTYITDNDGVVLTNGEKADAVAMKNKYDGLSTEDDKQKYIIELMAYTMQLSSGLISMNEWDAVFVDP